ncbi:MAG: hypothetical protein ACWGOY_07375 [Anaerolineales bacterium]
MKGITFINRGNPTNLQSDFVQGQVTTVDDIRARLIFIEGIAHFVYLVSALLSTVLALVVAGIAAFEVESTDTSQAAGEIHRLFPLIML